jgi:spore coat protein U-like protein
MKTMIRLTVIAALISIASPALAATQTSTFVVSANVVRICQVEALTNMSFGTYDTMSGTATDGAASFRFRCSKSTPYQIALEDGGLANYGKATGYASDRAMDNAGSFLAYRLFSDSGRTTEWKWTEGTDTIGASAASSGWVTLPIYGQIPPLQDVPAALTPYTNTVTITITY